MKEEFFRNVIKTLKSKDATMHCPACDHNKFTMLDSIFNLERKFLKGTTIPAVMLLCINCGYIRYHSLGILRLMPDEEETI
jgi:hypothetical protein